EGGAVGSADTWSAPPANPVWLELTGEIRAGFAPTRPIESGQCQRIMTGAMLPEGADAVVPVEELGPGEDDTRASILKGAAPGSNVRDAGADVRAGDVVL